MIILRICSSIVGANVSPILIAKFLRVSNLDFLPWEDLIVCISSIKSSWNSLFHFVIKSFNSSSSLLLVISSIKLLISNVLKEFSILLFITMLLLFTLIELDGVSNSKIAESWRWIKYTFKISNKI